MDIFTGLLNGFSIALTGTNILFCFIGALIGTAIGVLPGLGPAATIGQPIDYLNTQEWTAFLPRAYKDYGDLIKELDIKI